jgi:hypothetical protein
MDILNVWVSEIGYFSKTKGKVSPSQDILSNHENVIACCMTDQW